MGRVQQGEGTTTHSMVHPVIWVESKNVQMSKDVAVSRPSNWAISTFLLFLNFTEVHLKGEYRPCDQIRWRVNG